MFVWVVKHPCLGSITDTLATNHGGVAVVVQIEPELQKVPEDMQAYLKQGYRSVIIEENAHSDIRVKGK
jgi:hypothetical protein